MITLRQLAYFDALARLNHFGRAAEHCAVTQPALSMQIRELETGLGVKLVERRGASIAITEQGAEVARRAQEILASVRDLTDFARHSDHVLSGPLRLGIIPSIAPYLLPSTLAVLQERYPALDLQVRETLTGALRNELLEGGLDLLLVALPLDHPRIETMALFDDEFAVAVARRRRDEWKQQDVRRKLAGERLLLLEEGHCLRDQALQFCDMPRQDARRALGATSLTTIMQMVAAGYGVTLLPTLCAEVEVKDDRIALVRFDGDSRPKRIIGLAWRKSSPRRRDFLAFHAAVMAARNDALGATLLREG